MTQLPFPDPHPMHPPQRLALAQQHLAEFSPGGSRCQWLGAPEIVLAALMELAYLRRQHPDLFPPPLHLVK